MAPHVPQEIWDNITKDLSTLNPLRLSFLFKFKITLEAQKKHARVWRMLFRDEKWLYAAERYGLNPILIGFDLEYCYNRSDTNRNREKYLVL
jgi:hypothetical protein